MSKPLLQTVTMTLAGLVLLAAAPPRWFSTRGDPAYRDARAQLQVLVDADARRSANRFCVVGERFDGDTHAYVHWINEKRLILWEPQQGNPRAVAGSRRNLDLNRDVVAGNDVGGSTYRLTRATANRIINACRATGTRYLVTRTVRAHA